MAGAAMLAPEGNGNDLHIHPVFRVHEAPDESSLHRLEKVINSIVHIHSLDRCWVWRRGEETPGEYLSRLPRNGNEKRITETIERQILITNQRSFFSENPGEHFALKVDLYGRFSSPMREIVGIYSHKELLEKLGVENPETDEDELLIREQIINSANRAKETQKTIDRFVNDLLLHSVFNRELDIEPDKRPLHTGTILGMKETRMYVLLDSPKIEIKVYSEDIEQAAGGKLKRDDNILELENGYSGKIIFKAGEIIELRLYSFDNKGKWHFVPAGIKSLT
jgi:ribonuclease R